MEELTFDQSKARLEEIANLVEDPNISLDDALALYEEAVKIGLHACDVSEQDILLDEASVEDASGMEGAVSAEGSAEEAIPVGAGSIDILMSEDGRA